MTLDQCILSLSKLYSKLKIRKSKHIRIFSGKIESSDPKFVLLTLYDGRKTLLSVSRIVSVTEPLEDKKDVHSVVGINEGHGPSTYVDVQESVERIVQILNYTVKST